MRTLLMLVLIAVMLSTACEAMTFDFFHSERKTEKKTEF